MPYLTITRATLVLLSLLYTPAVLGVLLVDLGAELARREQQTPGPDPSGG